MSRGFRRHWGQPHGHPLHGPNRRRLRRGLRHEASVRQLATPRTTRGRPEGLRSPGCLRRLLRLHALQGLIVRPRRLARPERPLAPGATHRSLNRQSAPACIWLQQASPPQRAANRHSRTTTATNMHAAARHRGVTSWPLGCTSSASGARLRYHGCRAHATSSGRWLQLSSRVATDPTRTTCRVRSKLTSPKVLRGRRRWS